MDIFYGSRFSKDLDLVRHEPKARKRLLEIIKKLKAIDALTELKDIKKIEGYSDYFRIRVGD
jgi:mRNA interferase RelE/StbE